jgi:hypothetical protein
MCPLVPFNAYLSTFGQVRCRGPSLVVLLTATELHSVPSPGLRSLTTAFWSGNENLHNLWTFWFCLLSNDPRQRAGQFGIAVTNGGAQRCFKSVVAGHPMLPQPRTGTRTSPSCRVRACRRMALVL